MAEVKKALERAKEAMAELGSLCHTEDLTERDNVFFDTAWEFFSNVQPEFEPELKPPVVKRLIAKAAECKEFVVQEQMELQRGESMKAVRIAASLIWQAMAAVGGGE